jgi:hypothetical protein
MLLVTHYTSVQPPLIRGNSVRPQKEHSMFRSLSTGQSGCDRAIHLRNELKLPLQPAGLLGGVCGMLSLQHQGIQILLLKQPAMRNHGRDALCIADFEHRIPLQ